MNLVTFRSTAAHLRIDFPADRFGYRVLEGDFALDEAGRALIDPINNKPMFKKVPKDSARFGQKPNPPGCLRLDPGNPQQNSMIFDIRKSTGFGSLFWEEEAELSLTLAQLEGKVILTVPKEMMQEDREALDSLVVFYDRPIPAKALQSTRDKLEAGLKLFKVRGIVLPPDDPERNKRQLLGRVRDFLFALEDAGVMTFKPSENKGEDDQQGAA